MRTFDIILKKQLFGQKKIKITKKSKKVIALNEYDDYYNEFGCKAL